MEKNEIKKRLYKEDRHAILLEVRKDGILYSAFLGLDVATGEYEEKVHFLVPLSEIGETVWDRAIKAKLLIRYLI